MRLRFHVVSILLGVVGCGFDTTGSGVMSEGQGETSSGDETSSSNSSSSSGSGGTDAQTASTADLSSGTIPVGGCEEAGCDPEASCDASSGEVVCTCNEGFWGDGERCNPLELSTLRVDLECLEPDNCGGIGCSMTQMAQAGATLLGDPSVVYEVRLRFRGVVEQKSYSGPGRDGMFHPGATPADDGWNQFGLEVEAPKGVYYLNSGTSGTTYCFVLDEEHVVQVQGGALLTLAAHNGFDECGVRNADQDGTAIVVDGIPPAPDAVEGQFVQIDVVSITPT